MKKLVRPLYISCMVAAVSALWPFAVALGQCPVPQPASDVTTTFTNVAVTIDVQANDNSGLGVPLDGVGDTTVIVTPSPNGTAVVLNNDSVLFTPNPGYTGTTTFTYRVCDNCGCSNPVFVVVTVSAGCPFPMAGNDSYSVFSNSNTLFDVTANDNPVIGGSTTLQVIAGPANGTASVSGNQIAYAGNGVYTGPDTIWYSFCNSCGNCDTALVLLTVGPPCLGPDAVIDSGAVLQGNNLGIDVALNDQLNGSPVSSVSLLVPAANGASSMSGSVFTYQSNVGFTGTDSALYRICTTCGCDSAWIFIDVQALPCNPPNAVLDILASGFSDSCTFYYPVLNNDQNPANSGTLHITGFYGVDYGTVSIVNDTIVYTPDGVSSNVFDVFNYIICNACYCDTGTISIYHSPYPCNGYHPSIVNDNVHVCRNDTVFFNPTLNDFDPDGDNIHIDSIVTYPANCFVYLNGDVITIIPYPNYTGNDFMFYRACDDGTPSLCNLARIDIIVDPCDNPPSGPDTIYVTFPEGTSYTDCFTYTDADAEPAQITGIFGNDYPFTALTLGYADTLCVFMNPPENYNGVDVVMVVICDEYPKCDTVYYVVTVTPVNDPPVAMDDYANWNWGQGLILNVKANDYDIDGDPLTVDTVFDDNSVNATIILNANGSITYIPDSSFVGNDTFYYVITDGNGGYDTAMVVVHVPIRAMDDYATTDEDVAVDIDIHANDSPTPNFTITLCGGPSNGSVTINNTTGVATYTPNDEFFGLDSFCYELCYIMENNQQECDMAMVYITVNDLPEPVPFFPHGFSPDGDGVNDFFVIRNVDQFPNASLTVYNRWGDEVWKSDGAGYNNDFDGTWKKKGEPLPDGSYWYIFKFNDGKTADKMDYVIIQR